MVRLTDAWFTSEILRKIFGVCVLDVHNAARPQDRDYFRRTREARLKGATGAQQGSAAGLQAILEQTASEQGVREALKEIIPGDPSHARVGSASIGFDAWVAWVGRLQTEHGVHLENALVEALPESGKVKLQAAFSGVGR